MNDTYIFAIETSCDETSMAIIKNGNTVESHIIYTQIDTHSSFGGVVPEIASRMHTEKITTVLEEILAACDLSMEQMDAIAVTSSPGLMGSLLVGIECAKMLSMYYNKPLIAVHHTVGHIYANQIDHDLEFPLLALVVSGGHTDLIYMKDHYDVEILGSSIDDSIGEVFDKVARLMSIPYPGGPNIEKLARSGKETYNLPKTNLEGYNFSYSGLKSSVLNLIHNEKQRDKEIDKEDLSYCFQKVAFDQLGKKVEKALTEKQVKHFILAGGVSANQALRTEMKTICDKLEVSCHFPEQKYCTDNAAMIGAAAYPLFQKGLFADYSLNGNSSEDIKAYFNKIDEKRND